MKFLLLIVFLLLSQIQCQKISKNYVALVHQYQGGRLNQSFYEFSNLEFPSNKYTFSLVGSRNKTFTFLQTSEHNAVEYWIEGECQVKCLAEKDCKGEECKVQVPDYFNFLPDARREGNCESKGRTGILFKETMFEVNYCLDTSLRNPYFVEFQHNEIKYEFETYVQGIPNQRYFQIPTFCRCK